MIKRAILCLALALASGSVAAERKGPGAHDLRLPVVVGEDSGPAQLEVGQLLEVRLPMQAGTGYSWTPASGLSPNIELVTQVTLHPLGAQAMVGGSQTQMFIYRAIAPGEVTLTFGYRRPWETGVPPARIVSQRVTIGPWLKR